MKFFSIITISFAILAVSSAVPIEKRRFGQEHTPRADADFQAMKDIAVGTGFDAQLGDLSGAAVRALLAKAPACDQQDVADQMIDIARQIQKQGKADSETKFQQLVKVAQDYRTLERNTPNAGQPSELCNRAPRNPELKGLVQAQDPTGSGSTPSTPPNNNVAPAATPTTTGNNDKNAVPTATPTTTCQDQATGTGAPAATNPSTGNTPTGTTTDPNTGNTFLFGIGLEPITKNGDGRFKVQNSLFNALGNAQKRVCADQSNQCSQKANDCLNNKQTDCFQNGNLIPVNACFTQQAQCENLNPVVQGDNTAPANPDPANPDPANPDPANPDPANPDPANPDPANPDPANPDPANPDPANPAPANGKSATTPGTIITLDNTAFTNPVAGIKPAQIVVNQDGNPSVNGNRFLQLANAVQRACDIQNNACFNKFNAGDRTFSTTDCQNQRDTCTTGNPIFS